MQFNRIKSTNRFLIKFESILIDFCDSIPVVRLLVATNPIQNLGPNLNLTSNSNLTSNFFENRSNFIGNWSNLSQICLFLTFLDVFGSNSTKIDLFSIKIDRFRLINRHQIDLNRSFNQFYIEKDQFYVDLIEN